MTDTDTLCFSRRDLLKGGGALVIGFSIAGSPPAAAARGDVAGPPDPNAIDSWIAVHADNTATVYLGKGEFGQGNTTGLLQIAGEELDLDMSQLRWVQLDTNVTPTRARPPRARRFIAAGGRFARRPRRRVKRCWRSPRRGSACRREASRCR